MIYVSCISNYPLIETCTGSIGQPNDVDKRRLSCLLPAIKVGRLAMKGVSLSLALAERNTRSADRSIKGVVLVFLSPCLLGVIR